ncbi:MAG: hypothetical protein RLZZ511_2505 [Cyanobacteriota bacterium]|jgi:hypothetical protein
MINNKFFTGVLIAAAALTGALTQASSATAFTWNNAWTQSTIYSGTSQGFNHQPFQKFVQTERLALQNAGLKQVDASKLLLKYDHDVKVSFINEGAGYRNQLAFKSMGTTNTSNLLFNDVSCAGKTDGVNCVLGGANTLKLGDTVKAGMIKGGSQLDFFLRSDGFNKQSNAYIYGTQTAQNADKLQHTVAYTFGGRYLVLGFEDLYGDGKSGQGKFGEKSDRDFNDTVFAVDIGENNVRFLNGEKVPEPAAAVGLIGLGAAAWMKRRRVAK